MAVTRRNRGSGEPKDIPTRKKTITKTLGELKDNQGFSKSIKKLAETGIPAKVYESEGSRPTSPVNMGGRKRRTIRRKLNKRKTRKH